MGQLSEALGLIGLPHLGFELWWRHRRHFEPRTAWNARNNAFFVHIPKTAGTSIYDSLGMDALPYTHAPARILRDLYPKVYDAAFSFAIVRNPWDRFVSTYAFLRDGTVWDEQKQWAERHIGTLSFGDFVLKLRDNYRYRAAILSYNFFYTQNYFVSDRRGQGIVDRIFHFEALDAGFKELAARFGVPAQLAHSRQTQKRRDFTEYYDAQTWAIVGALYAADVKAFGYDPRFPGAVAKKHQRNEISA